MSIRITTKDADGNEVVTTLPGNSMKGYIIRDGKITKKGEEVPSSDNSSSSNSIRSRFKELINKIINNERDNTK